MRRRLSLDDADVPPSVGASAIRAIVANSDRLERATEADDTEQMIGASKELVECVAKVVLDALGHTYGSDEDVPRLTREALDALGVHPSSYQGRPPIQRLTGSLVQVPNAVAELRNQDGTGHGRVNLTDLRDASAEYAVSAAVAWSHWILAALGEALKAVEQVNQAANDLRTQVFYRGQMPQLLEELGLANLAEDQQHTLGLAVARRWAESGTFLAQEDVIRPLAQGQVDYPSGFARGTFEGLLFTARGNLRTDPVSLREAAAIGNRLDQEAAGKLSSLITAIEAATPSYEAASPDHLRVGLDRAVEQAELEAVRGVFEALRSKLDEENGQ